MRRRAKKDDNHAFLEKEMKKIPGLSMEDTSRMGDGFPDAVLGYCKRNFLLEIKNPEQPPSKRKLTGDELLFKNRHKGQYDVVMTIPDIISVLVNGLEYNDVQRLNIWTQQVWGIDANGFRKS